MKNLFTVKDIVDGTGLTRQRVHQLLETRRIRLLRYKSSNRIFIEWQELLKLADNPVILDFLRHTLDSEKKNLERTNMNVRINAFGMQYAYVLLMEKDLPTPEGVDSNWINLFREAYAYWCDIIYRDLSKHWALK